MYIFNVHFWGGGCTPLLCKYTPLSVFQSLLHRHKNNGMQSWSVLGDHYQTVTHMQVHSNWLCNSDACGRERLDSRLVLWTSPPCTPLIQNSGENTGAWYSVRHHKLPILGSASYTSGDSGEFRIWSQAASHRYVGVVMGLRPSRWRHFYVAVATACDVVIKNGRR